MSDPFIGKFNAKNLSHSFDDFVKVSNRFIELVMTTLKIYWSNVAFGPMARSNALEMINGSTWNTLYGRGC